jgi:hypothetical protein
MTHSIESAWFAAHPAPQYRRRHATQAEVTQESICVGSDYRVLCVVRQFDLQRAFISVLQNFSIDRRDDGKLRLLFDQHRGQSLLSL